MKTSHIRNRPFDFKLIDLVEPNDIIYRRQKGLTNFQVMKIKNEIWNKIANEMVCSADFCLMRWNNLRGQFQKEFRRCKDLCPKNGYIRGSTWPYLERLRFLEDTLQCNRTKNISSSKRKKKKPCEQTLTYESTEHTNLSSNDCATAKSGDEETFMENFEALSDILDENDFIEDMMLSDNADEPLYECEPKEQITIERVESPPSAGDDKFSEYCVEMPQEMPQVYNYEQPDESNNMFKILQLIDGFDSERQLKIERRIMAYLCKINLRYLNQNSIDDIVI